MVARKRWLVLLALAWVAGCGGGGGGGSPVAPTPTRTILTTTVVQPQSWLGVSLHCLGGISTGLQGFVPGPETPPRGAGSYGLVVGTDGNSLEGAAQTGFAGVSLADLTELTYATFVGATGVFGLGFAPTIALTLDVNADGFWEPVNDDVLVFAPLGAVVRVWQSWDALGGTWCNDIACGTMAEFRAANPNARLINAGFGTVFVSAGCLSPEFDNFEAAFDVPAIGVGLNITEYDFEP